MVGQCVTRKKQRGFLSLLIISVFMLAVLFGITPQASSPLRDSVWIVELEGDIDPGMLLFAQKSYESAISGGAGAIIFQIDTYGGYIDDAIRIKDLIINSVVPTVCYVDNKAISAGALLALAGENMVMSPGATIGAAAPLLGDEPADEKVVSMWAGQLASAAENRGRNGQIAAAMADADIEIAGVIEKGKLLTLTNVSALDCGISDATVADAAEIPALFNFSVTEIGQVLSLGFQDTLIKLLSSPYVTAILLMLGIAGIVIEVFTAGFGIAGAIGVISFALYFAANFWAGHADIVSILVFVAGLILLAVEIFVTPGFGVPGMMGILAIFGGIVLASPDIGFAVTSLALALIGAVGLIVLSFKFGKTRKAWNRLILSLKQENKAGYVAPSAHLSGLEGKTGVAVTTLRPSGTAIIEGVRVDVVTDGEYIEAESAIRVLRVEGTRVIVQKADNKN